MMEDDIHPKGRIASHASARLSTEIDRLLKHLAPRHDAKRWARTPRFLTFDDGDESVPSSLSSATGTGSSPVSNSGQCRRCAEQVPLPSGHICAVHSNVHMTPEQLTAREESLKNYTSPCVHVKELTCDICRHIPLFPNTGEVSTFKIRRAALPTREGDEATSCQHFVAVSYCWSSQGSDNAEEEPDSKPYTVVEENGSKRAMRASKGTIDRAVAFARENGFRMIWIDQECIEQDKEDEKELSINSMDLIYQNAHTCIGLLNTSWEQRHWDAISAECEAFIGQHNPHRRGTRPSAERYSRARKGYFNDLCEAVFGLLFDRWNTRAWILQEAFVSADRMFLLFPRNEVNTEGWHLVCNEKSMSEVAVNLDMIQHTLEGKVFPLLNMVQTSEQGEAPRSDNSTKGFLTPKVILDVARYFYPRAMDSYGRIGVGSVNIRRRCDAAAALAYLNRRQLFRVADRIAIFANLCGYEERLNTVELEKSGHSLSLCILALSVANGDLSLLAPEMYKIPSGYSPIFPSGSSSEFSWVHSLTKNLHLLDSAILLPSSNTTIVEDARMYSLSSDGLSLLGTLWEIADFIDLEPIKVKHSDGWRLAKQPEAGPQARRQATALILFDTIMLLKTNGMIQAADAILNSVSDPLWCSQDRNTGSDVVESVLQMPTDLTVEKQEDMFLFSWVIGGMPHQSWIIDRIMDTGGIWLSRPVDCYKLPFRSDMDSSSEPKSKLHPTRSRSLELFSKLTSSSVQTWMNHIFEASAHLAEESHCGRLFQISFFTKLLARLQDDELSSDGTTAAREDTPGRLSKLASLFSGIVPLAQWSRLLTEQVHQSEFLDRRAIFDVEGSESRKVLVLTPFQAQLESVPRSKVRNFSVSWTVEPADGGGEGIGENNEEVEKRFRVTGMVKGMWRYTLLNSGRFTLV
ncbi:heterokaryon incompatibility protein-domain-containing protein [Xylariales sp. PMI_506]|nr:heterokaryon incompatibility protein-domain-containing protein [Xylariales sp. PMI_506]